MLDNVLRQIVTQSPEQHAIVFGESVLSYRELLEHAERLARGLSTLGIGPGGRVAVVHSNSPEVVVAFLAITRLGAIVVPLNPLYQQEELSYYFEECEVEAVISDDKRLPACESALNAGGSSAALIVSAATSDAHITLSSLMDEHRTGPVPDDIHDETANAVYQYSSGSTGRSKRVPRTHAQLIFEADSVVATMDLGPKDRILCAVPLFHTHGQGNCMLAAIRSGATLVILRNANPFLLYREDALKLLEEESVTLFPGVPFMFRMLANASYQPDLSSLRLCFSAGSPLPQETFAAFQHRFGIPVRQLYGCTEAGALTINLDKDPTSTAASVGKPLDGVIVEIIDDSGRPVPLGKTGEVVVKTQGMTNGYHGLDEQNREVFRDGAYYTGDVGRLDTDGRLWLTGRRKLFIEVVGNKVDPVEVEDILINHPAVLESVVVGVPSGVPGEELVKAVVVPGGPLEEGELMDYCAERLASFKVPALFEFREEIPKSPLGKVLRKYLV